MEWRTSQVPRAALIGKSFSPFGLLDAICNENHGVFLSICDGDGSPVFSSQDVVEICDRLKEPQVMYRLESCPFEDRPQIRVSKLQPTLAGKPRVKSWDFAKLSLGQQQSILLSIMLFSKSKSPLVIDQPEDNLDSEFIYKTFVKSLRMVTEHRQVIIVTHNPNIAVLGDAELIVPLKAGSDHAVIRDRGSIDTLATKRLACGILEGSEEAFKRRQAVYGF